MMFAWVLCGSVAEQKGEHYTGCHAEVNKWCLDDCQDDETLLWDLTSPFDLEHHKRGSIV